MSTKFVSRAAAGLRESKSLTPINNPVDIIVIHHSAATVDINPLKTWSQIQGFHMFSNGWADIAYTVGAGVDRRDGAKQPVVMEGRVVGNKAAVGAHTLGYNSKAVAVCIPGNYVNDGVDAELIEAVLGAIQWLKDTGKATQNPIIESHSKFVRTACAGANMIVRIPEIREASNGGISVVPLPPTPVVPQLNPYPGFNLPDGHWFGVANSNVRNHSGFWAEDRPKIWQFKSQLERRGWKIAVTDRFDEATKQIVIAFQKEKGLKPDGLVGTITHRTFWEAPIT